MMTYLSDEELSAIGEEVEKADRANLDTFSLSVEQALVLVAELISKRGAMRSETPRSRQIDLFDTSYVIDTIDNPNP